MDISTIRQQQKELTMLFNKGIEYDMYEFGDCIIENSLYYSHIKIKDKWYLTIEDEDRNKFKNVKRDYIKETLGIYEDEFLKLFKLHEIPTYLFNLVDFHMENFEIVDYIAKINIKYENKIYQIILFYCYKEVQVLRIEEW